MSLFLLVSCWDDESGFCCELFVHFQFTLCLFFVLAFDFGCLLSEKFSVQVFFPFMKLGGTYLPDREASLIKKEYCRCGPHPLQMISSRARPYLLRERAALAAFSRISGVGHSGS